MKKLIFPLFVLIAFIGCEESTIIQSESETQIPTKEVAVEFEKNITTKATSHLTDLISLTERVAIEQNSLRVPANSLSKIVAALNDQDHLLFIAMPNEEESLKIGAHETAITLSYFFSTPLTDVSKTEFRQVVAKRDEFQLLANRIRFLADNNTSFATDSQTFELLNTLLATISDDLSPFTSERSFSKPDIEIESTGEQAIKLSNKSYIPYHIRGKNVSTGEIFYEEKISGKLFSKLHGEFNTDVVQNIPLQNNYVKFEIGISPEVSLQRKERVIEDALFILFKSIGLSPTEARGINSIKSKLLADNSQKQSIPFSEIFNTIRSKYVSQKSVISDVLIQELREKGIRKSESNVVIPALVSLLANTNMSPLLYSTDYFYQDLKTIDSSSLTTFVCSNGETSSECSTQLTASSYSFMEDQCVSYDHKIKMYTQFSAPLGLPEGVQAKVDWSFLPAGSSGFWITDVNNSNAQLSGKIEIQGCFSYGSQQDLEVVISLVDDNDITSNEVTYTIPNPDGNNAAKVVSSKPEAGKWTMTEILN
ncbi:MAG: hypothetical protein FH748_00330 [Balneolaceae bacterium]|nr:hypothetical protein [Balneolaceae bacterium]